MPITPHPFIASSLHPYALTPRRLSAFAAIFRKFIAAPISAKASANSIVPRLFFLTLIIEYRICTKCQVDFEL